MICAGKQYIEIRMKNTKKMHDAIVGFHKQEYDQVGLIERDKRNYFTMLDRD